MLIENVPKKLTFSLTDTAEQIKEKIGNAFPPIAESYILNRCMHNSQKGLGGKLIPLPENIPGKDLRTYLHRSTLYVKKVIIKVITNIYPGIVFRYNVRCRTVTSSSEDYYVCTST